MGSCLADNNKLLTKEGIGERVWKSLGTHYLWCLASLLNPLNSLLWKYEWFICSITPTNLPPWSHYLQVLVSLMVLHLFPFLILWSIQKQPPSSFQSCILVYSSYCSKRPQPGYFIKNGNSSFTMVDAGESKVNVPADLISGEGLPCSHNDMFWCLLEQFGAVSSHSRRDWGLELTLSIPWISMSDSVF